MRSQVQQPQLKRNDNYLFIILFKICNLLKIYIKI